MGPGGELGGKGGMDELRERFEGRQRRLRRRRPLFAWFCRVLVLAVSSKLEPGQERPHGGETQELEIRSKHTHTK